MTEKNKPESENKIEKEAFAEFFILSAIISGLSIFFATQALYAGIVNFVLDWLWVFAIYLKDW